MRVLVQSLAFASISALVFPTAGFAETQYLFATAMSPIVQNTQADEDDLSRIGDDETLERFADAKLLLPVPSETKHYYVKAVPAKYRYLRPWSKRFLDNTAREYFARFHDRLRVTSMVRTGELQLQLAGYNPNAAPATGPTQSSHLTGATLDISKAKMNAVQKNWMRERLLELKEDGTAYGIEERLQPTFHVMVFKSYGPASATAEAEAEPFFVPTVLKVPAKKAGPNPVRRAGAKAKVRVSKAHAHGSRAKTLKAKTQRAAPGKSRAKRGGRISLRSRRVA